MENDKPQESLLGVPPYGFGVVRLTCRWKCPCLDSTERISPLDNSPSIHHHHYGLICHHSPFIMVSQSVHHHQSMIIMIWLCPKTENTPEDVGIPRDTGGTGLLSFSDPYPHQLATFERPPVPSGCRSYPIPKGVSSPAQSPTKK